MSPAATYIFGMHDPGAEQLFLNASRPGWVVVSVQLNPPDFNGDFTLLSQAGMTVIARLNNGYDSNGTIPVSTQYATFAQQCASFVAASSGANIWIIGNEPNLAWERPGNDNGAGGQVITPDMYASCFEKCRTAIKAVPGHSGDWVIPAAVAPWNIQTTYATNRTGDWVQYFRDMLNACNSLGATPDAIAIHTYTHGYDVSLITGERLMASPFQSYHYDFRAYRDFIGAIPASLQTLPLLITEAQPVDPDWWQNSNIGWVRTAYAEIDNWNAVATNPPIQALCLFRWQTGETQWSMSDKPVLLNDFRSALLNNYRVHYPADPAGEAAIAAAQAYTWMPINTDAALYRFAQTTKLGYPQTDEFEFTFGDETYIGQVYNLGVAYVKKGDWGNVEWTPKA